MIERAVITARDGRLNFDRALPEADRADSSGPAPSSEDGPPRIRTAQEMESLEHENLLRALESTGWRVAGEHGAARLLGMNPSTLNSRMKALGLKRPR